MTGFTPGLWHALDIGEIVPSDGDGYPHSDLRICFMATAGGNADAEQRIQANARLIASAPSLYEALAGLLSALETTGVLDGPKGKELRAKGHVALASAGQPKLPDLPRITTPVRQLDPAAWPAGALDEEK